MLITSEQNDPCQLIYAFLNEGDKIRECYRYLKMIKQPHLHVAFFTVFFLKRISIKRFYLYMKLLQSSIIFKQKISWSALRLKFLLAIFYNSQFQKYNCNSMHSYNRKTWVDTPSYVIFLNCTKN